MTILLMVITLVTGLMAGLYLGWAISVLPGYWLLDDRAMLTAFQKVNRAIYNVSFISLFVATIVAAPIVLVFQWGNFGDQQRVIMIAASILVVAGHFLVTFLGNIPINKRLDKMHISEASESDIANMRDLLKVNWRRLHWTRTIATTAAFFLLLMVLGDYAL